jgi:hypothetical protein
VLDNGPTVDHFAPVLLNLHIRRGKVSNRDVFGSSDEHSYLEISVLAVESDRSNTANDDRKAPHRELSSSAESNPTSPMPQDDRFCVDRRGQPRFLLADHSETVFRKAWTLTN